MEDQQEAKTVPFPERADAEPNGQPSSNDDSPVSAVFQANQGPEGARVIEGALRFVDQMNAENEGGGMYGAADPYPADLDWLINRVNNVVLESAQLGTEPLTTKAATLAALYQAQALREIADEMGHANHILGELCLLLRSVTVDVPVFGTSVASGEKAIRTR